MNIPNINGMVNSALRASIDLSNVEKEIEREARYEQLQEIKSIAESARQQAESVREISESAKKQADMAVENSESSEKYAKISIAVSITAIIVSIASMIVQILCG